MKRNPSRQNVGYSRWHILEIEGHDIRPFSESFQLSRVVVIALDERRNLPGAGVCRRIENLETQAQWITGQRQHSRQLPAANDSNVHCTRLRGSG